MKRCHIGVIFRLSKGNARLVDGAPGAPCGRLRTAGGRRRCCPPPAPHPPTFRPPPGPTQRQPAATAVHRCGLCTAIKLDQSPRPKRERGAGACPLRGRSPSLFHPEAGEAVILAEARKLAPPGATPRETDFPLHLHQRSPSIFSPIFHPPPYSSFNFHPFNHPPPANPPTFGGHPSRSGASAL